MKLMEWIIRPAPRIGFGQRRSLPATLEVETAANDVKLNSAFGNTATLSMATDLQAGVMTAADKAKLDALQNSTVSVDTANFNSRGQVIASTINDPLVAYIRTAGYATPGDGGGALYVRALSEPAHEGKVQSADGTWWEYAPEGRTWRAEVFGVSTANSAADNNTALMNALSALSPGDTLETTANGVLDFSDVTIAIDNVTLIIGPQTVLNQTVIDQYALKITGEGVVLTGGGTVRSQITGPQDYFVTGSNIGRAIVHVRNNGFVAHNIGIDTPSRCGIFIDNTGSATIRDCWGRGGYAPEDYDGTTTLNLYAVYVDPAPSESNVLTVQGCQFETYITPIATGNLVGGASTVQPHIVANRFERCWDHAVYFLNSRKALIANNVIHDCRGPIVLDGDGGRVVGNVFTASGTDQSYHEMSLSLRDTTNTVIEGNLIEGVGAYIDISDFNGVDLLGNVIRSNNLISTAPSAGLDASIRVRSTGTAAITDNVIENNTIVNVTASAFQGAITIFGQSGRGARNVVRGNTVTLKNSIFGLYAQNTDETVHINNTYDRSGYDAQTPETLDFIFFTGTARVRSENNLYRYATGGTNVTGRGVNIAASAQATILRREAFEISSPNLTDAIPIVDVGAATQRSDNQVSLNEPIEGQVTLAASTAQSIISNGNIISGARVSIVPADQDAYDVFTQVGVYVVTQPAAKRFLMVTGNGAATPKASLWNWRISV